jgi:hypothetical protein
VEDRLLKSNDRLLERTMIGTCLLEIIKIEAVRKICTYFENHRRPVSKKFF